MMSRSLTAALAFTCKVLIVHTHEAQEWASYLQSVLRSSQLFSPTSIELCAIDSAVSHHQLDHAVFEGSTCIVLLLSMALLELQSTPYLDKMFTNAFHPPNKMVLFYCGVSDSEIMSTVSFRQWQSWRKLYPDDDPETYISTVLEAIADDGESVEVKDTQTKISSDVIEKTELEDSDDSVSIEEHPELTVLPQESSATDQELQIPPGDTVNEDNEVLTIQPNRIVCGTQVTVYIILKSKLDSQLKTEVQFSCEEFCAKREKGTVENEYTVSVTSPDMPPGSVAITMYNNDSVVCSASVVYCTGMEEVGRCLDNITNPIEFMCQAFNITSNRTESIDNLLADLLERKIPSGFQIFGMNQLEDNMSAYQRSDESPTLLHFAAKYGLKKLMTLLLQCPGALQAYSVVNKHGDYPNTIAEKNGFLELRQFMDEYLETADILKCHIERSAPDGQNVDVYEAMSNTSQDKYVKYSLDAEYKDDIYESMMALNPDCIEDLYEDMERHDSLNHEEAMLWKFFQAGANSKSDKHLHPVEEETREEESEGGRESAQEDEDPYNFCLSEEIYDTVDEPNQTAEIVNRPPAPIPRPSQVAESEETKTYISRVFSEQQPVESEDTVVHRVEQLSAGPVSDRSSTLTYDPYAGMKTPGQRQLISLQERVKVGEINVEEAVLEFKSWQLNQEKRSHSIRFQQENLKRLRESITRRHKDKIKMGKEIDMEITAPLPPSSWWGCPVKMECAVYEPSPCMSSQGGPAFKRGTWKSESTSSNASTGSNRLSTHSAISYSSGAENDYEENFESPVLPFLPPRNTEVPPVLPPPRIPPRLPERFAEGLVSERYISCPSRCLPQRPKERSGSPPPIPRRLPR